MQYRTMLYRGLAVGLALLAGCHSGIVPTTGSSNPTTTLTVNISGKGSVNPAAGNYAQGAKVVVTATASVTGWHFTRWEGDTMGINSRTLVLMNGDMNITAVFEPDSPVTLTTKVEGQGTVQPDNITVAKGDNVTLTATPADGWSFVQWSDGSGNTSTTNPFTFALNRDMTVTATFQDNASSTVALTVNVTGQGTVQPDNGTFHKGDNVTLTATPAAGWSFVQWSGGATGTDNTTTITLNTDTQVNAQFAQNITHVQLQTTKGNITLELDRTKAPVTVDNFLTYVNEGFYDGRDGKGATIFHRVIPNFMIQGGGFTDNLTQKTTHAAIINESNNGLTNDRGTIAMARTTDPNSATSQFFINVVNNSSLNYQSASNPGYAVFGKVIAGMDVADVIVAVPTHSVGIMNDVPIDPITITSAQVVP